MNVASNCGMTDQNYKGLEKLYRCVAGFLREQPRCIRCPLGLNLRELGLTRVGSCAAVTRSRTSACQRAVGIEKHGPTL